MPDGYWSEEKILKELQNMFRNNGRVLSREELRKNPYTKKLCSAIDNKGGRNYFLKKLGIKPLQESSGFWTRAETLKRLQNLSKKLGYFPTHQEIKKYESVTLSDMVTKYGGSESLAKELGFSMGYKGKLHGWNLEEVYATIKLIIAKTGKFPSSSWLQRNGYSGLVASIYSKFSGLEVIAKELGFEMSNHIQVIFKDIGMIGKM